MSGDENKSNDRGTESAYQENRSSKATGLSVKRTALLVLPSIAMGIGVAYAISIYQDRENRARRIEAVHTRSFESDAPNSLSMQRDASESGALDPSEQPAAEIASENQL